MTNGDSVPGIARWRNIGGIIKVEGIELVLFPHLPVGAEEIAGLVGLSIRTHRRFSDVVVTGDRAVPAVGGQLDGASKPELFEFSGATGGCVFGSPTNLVIVEEGTELTDFEEGHLIAELGRIDVKSGR